MQRAFAVATSGEWSCPNLPRRDAGYLASHPVADFTLPAGGSHQITAGLAWTELVTSELGDTITVTYTIVATA